jgi:CheY-like chemotaxis protein
MLDTSTRILIVDDMASACEVIKKLLADLGYTNTSLAHDANNAKKLLTESLKASPFGIVFSDINMPGENGLQFLEWIRCNPQTAKLPVIMVSASGEQANVVQAANLGANAFLVKPVQVNLLKDKLARLGNAR